MTTHDVSSLGTEDSSWFDEFVREPENVKRKLNEKSAFDSMYDRHEKLHPVYMQLGTAISKFKR